MPIQPLPSIPNGADVFIDANIFVYALQSKSAQCREFLRRCAYEELFGISLLEIVNEATHQLMLAEAVAKGFIPSPSPKVLRKHFSQIPQLTMYWAQTRRILSLNLLLVGTSENLLHAAQLERQAAGLLTNDSMIAACMRDLGIQALATNDDDFARVGWITVYKPDDI